MESTMIRDMTKGPVVSQLFRFAMPLFFSNALQAVYNLVDMVIVGNYIGAAGISAVSIGGDILHLLTFVAMGFSSAGQVIIARSGGVMRVAPIGLYFAENHVPMEESDRIGAEAAALTHGHPLGWLPAAALAHIIRYLIEHENEPILAAVQDAITALPEVFPNTEDLVGFQGLLQRAIDLSAAELDDLEAIGLLGQGWVGDEALAIAVYCALKHADDFEAAVVAAVNHGGDSDSTGAITGNIMGAALGLAAIPQKYIEALELKDVLLELAEDLYHDCRMSEHDPYEDPIWTAKYVRMDYRK